MATITRLPAFPLITCDPYFSIWSCADAPTTEDTRHWAGERKRITGRLTVDGTSYRYLGTGVEPAMALTGLTVTPTSTHYQFVAENVALSLRFTAPLLLDDLDTLSTPINLIDFELRSLDGASHAAHLEFILHDDICYDGSQPPAMLGDHYKTNGLCLAYMGQKRQGVLCHSGDHITIDWGYAYLAAAESVTWEPVDDHSGLVAQADFSLDQTPAAYHLLAGYDDVASINYFGFLAPAWYARNGRQLTDALVDFSARRESMIAACQRLDEELLASARSVGGEDYAFLLAAAYRQTIAAHKLIVDREGNPVFLSKECDSNGCIGTVDVSYPSIPLYLIYNPELVRAMCRQIFKFAHLPCWEFDFAPHDVGRYPHATGQVYALKSRRSIQNGEVYPPVYRYPAGCDLYDLRNQMPVEECGNMLIMLAAAYRADGNLTLAQENMDLLERWVTYLEQYGEDPGEQLCTDDFAGHMARNINLAGKAISGIASFALIKRGLGEESAYEAYMEKARAMAARWQERAQAGDHTALTFDGNGWSMKYNLVWDILFGLDLLPRAWYARETSSYLSHLNKYGLPLDSRADYTKSDWIAWCAAMAQDQQVFSALIAPLVKYLRETESRVPFSDWYDTKTGKYEHFINRTVQGGLFMPMLRAHWKK